MCIGASRPHLGRNPYRLHQFLTRGAVAECGLGMPLNAVRALRHVCHGDRDLLLGLCRQRTVSNTWRLNAWKAFSVSGTRARRFSASSRDDGGYIISVIPGLLIW
jgi:hypothetical protein